MKLLFSGTPHLVRIGDTISYRFLEKVYLSVNSFSKTARVSRPDDKYCLVMRINEISVMLEAGSIIELSEMKPETIINFSIHQVIQKGKMRSDLRFGATALSSFEMFLGWEKV